MSQRLAIKIAGTSEIINILIQPNDKVGDVIRRFKQQRPNSPDFVLVWAGTILQENKFLKDYNILNQTMVILVMKTTNAVSDKKIVWTRPPFQPIPTITPPDFVLPGDDVAKFRVMVWCKHNEHIPIVNAADPDSSYPQQLQEGSIRGRCKRCKQEAYHRITALRTWNDILQNEIKISCFFCAEQNRADSEEEFYFKCKGQLTAQNANRNRTICNSDALILPNIIYNAPLSANNNNIPPVASIDSGDFDTIQVKFHGYQNSNNNGNNNNNNGGGGNHRQLLMCDHRMDVNGLGIYLTQYRKTLVRNGYCPAELGELAIRCISPNCNGLLFRPSIRIAGEEIYQTLNDFVNQEAVMKVGGVLCNTCNRAYIPKQEESGPERLCPNCNSHFCEEHGIEWIRCPHTTRTLQPDIENALTEANLIRCPGCKVAGIKDANCTHITCKKCSVPWCYFCGKKRSDDGHANGIFSARPLVCPQFLNSQWPPARNVSGAEATALLHRYRTLRILKALRDRDPAEFDIAFPKVPSNLIFTIRIPKSGAIKLKNLSIDEIRNHNSSYP